MANSVDVVLLRKRRRARQRIIKLLLFLIFAGFAILIYVRRDVWFPKLEGIGTRYQNITQNEDVADDAFSLSISGGVNYSADFINKDLFILCDKYLYIYGSDGKLKDSRQHAYSNAAMKIAGSRALLYSVNGTNFRVDSLSKMLYEVTTEQPIWFGVLADDGKTAIVTESETFACRLCIYDNSGKLMYTRECVDRLSDVSFFGNGCIFSTIGASEGDLETTLQYITFDSDSVQWNTTPLPTLCMDMYALNDGGVFVIGDTKAAYYSSTGALLGSYDYNADLIDYTFSDEKGAVLLKNEQRRQSILLLFSDRSAAPVSVSLDTIAKNVVIDGETVYLLDNGRIRSYAFSGEEMNSTSVKDAYDRILKQGKYFYLLGYDTINRMEID